MTELLTGPPEDEVQNLQPKPPLLETGKTPDDDPSHESAQKDVAEQLGSLSLVEATDTDPEAVEELSKTKLLSKLRERANKIYDRMERYAPAVASAVTYENDSTTEFFSPTAHQLKEESFWLSLFSGFCSFFGFGSRFDAYIENKARARIAGAARRITIPLKVMGTIERPRDQFLKEVGTLYKYLQGDSEKDSEDADAETPTQDMLPRMIDSIGAPAEYLREKDAIDPEEYPVIGKLLPSMGYSSRLGLPRQRAIRAASPEIMEGIGNFLQSHGALEQQDADATKPVPIPSFSSMTRKLITIFAPQKLNKLPVQVEAALTQAYSLLPEDGHKFAQSVYTLCAKVSDLAHNQGVDGKTITAALLKDFHLRK
ncbi:MAG TPA: hypothetical protein VLH38_01585 [Patescibacteria group bacterium]|nr:hypothetical protein [Patescibacteria group bacterium]